MWDKNGCRVGPAYVFGRETAVLLLPFHLGPSSLLCSWQIPFFAGTRDGIARGNVKTIQFALPSRMIRHGPPRPKVHIPMLFVRERISHYHTPILSLHYLCDFWPHTTPFLPRSRPRFGVRVWIAQRCTGHRLPISSVNLFTVSTTFGAAVPRAPMPTSANLG